MLLAIVAALAAFQGWRTKPLDINNPDGQSYLGAAWNLTHNGVYSDAGPNAPTLGPAVFREPFYSTVVAGLMRVSGVFAAAPPECLFSLSAGCADALRPFQMLNVAFYALAAVFLFFSAFALTGSTPAGFVAALAIMLNYAMQTERWEVVSDYLALAIVSAAILAGIHAARRRSVALWFLVGLLLAALTLTKAVYLYFAVVMVPLAGFWILATQRANRVAVFSFLAFIVAYAPPVAGWMARNHAVLGEWVITKGRGSLVLGQRAFFNEMTPGEYAISFVWWTRGVGAPLIRRYFPDAPWRRFEIFPDEKYPTDFHDGGVRRHQETLERLQRERGLNADQAEAAAMRIYRDRILADLPRHLVVTIPAFYRGATVDLFWFFSIPALIVLGIVALRRRDWLLLAVLSPGAFSLFFHALFTPNPPRFQIPAMASLALASAVAVHRLARRRRSAAGHAG